MIDDVNRKRIIDAIALLEQVLRSTDTSIQSAAVLRALETAKTGKEAGLPGTAGAAGGGGGDYGMENIRWHKQL